MTEAVKIAQTSQRGLEPVSSKLAGQFEHLRALLKQRLGPDHAFLYAEPVPLGSAHETAWFVEAEARAVRLVDLPLQQRSAIEAKLSALAQDIRALAEQLSKQGDAGRDISRILVDSLVLPGVDRVWAVDGRPVMVDWGWREATEVGTPRDVRTLLATEVAPTASMARDSGPGTDVPQAAAMISQPPRDRRRDWLTPGLWGLFILLLCLIGAMLLRACAIGGASWPEFLRVLLPDACPVASAPVNAEVLAAEQAMRAAELDLLRAQVRCQRECVAPAVTPQPPAADPAIHGSAAPASRELEQGVVDANLSRGRLEVILGWSGTADLDLSIACPDGKIIGYSTRTNCGGVLDFDINSNALALSASPIEHITWAAEPSQQGLYKVIVNLYSLRQGSSLPVPYRVLVKRGHAVIQEKTGVFSGLGDTDIPLTFQIPAAP